MHFLYADQGKGKYIPDLFAGDFIIYILDYNISAKNVTTKYEAAKY